MRFPANPKPLLGKRDPFRARQAVGIGAVDDFEPRVQLCSVGNAGVQARTVH